MYTPVSRPLAPFVFNPPSWLARCEFLKIGNFTLSFNDLTIPVSGIPITITRTYDSRNRTTGDFGAGWTLDIKDIEVID
jgi:hypothetical protein